MSFVVGIVVVVGLEWELTPFELIETVEEGVDKEDVDFSVDTFTGKLVVVVGGVSDVPVMLQSEKTQQPLDGDEFYDETDTLHNFSIRDLSCKLSCLGFISLLFL